MQEGSEMATNTTSLATYFKDLNTLFWFYILAIVSLLIVVFLVVGWKMKWGTLNFIAALVVCVLCSLSFTFTGHYLQKFLIVTDLCEQT